MGVMFANSFTVDTLLQIMETFADDFRKLAADTLTYMLRSEVGFSMDILRLFKELGGSEKLITLMTSTKSENVKGRLLVLLQTLTSGDDQDILADLHDLNIVPLLLQLLVAISDGKEQKSAPALMGSILTTLTNLSLNDQNNVSIRIHGAHIIGGILMQNCPSLSTGDSKKHYSEDASDNIKI